MTTLSELRQRRQCLVIDDIAFFADREPDWYGREAFGLWLSEQEWFQPFLSQSCKDMPKDPSFDRLRAEHCIMDIHEAYAEAKRKRTKPDWLQHIPSNLAQFLDHYWFRVESYAYKIIPYFPHTGFGFVALEDGLIQTVDKIFSVTRLNHIKQLASLFGPVVTSEPMSDYPFMFGHTRYEHSLEVCALATIVGHSCGLPKNDFLHLRIAAQSHDTLTPAGGDSLKAIDPKAFDEDANFPMLFKRRDWQAFRNNLGLSEEKLFNTIQGRGLLGNILDACDKLAYTALDVYHFLQRNRPGGFAHETFERLYDKILCLLHADPLPCSIWECMETHDDQLVFTDTERLMQFLRLRALMFRILYSNGSARFVEAGFVAEIASLLYQDGTLTRDNLLSMGDNQLSSILNNAAGSDNFSGPFVMLSHADPRVETFATLKEAQDFERQVATDNPATMTRLEEAPPPSVKCLETFNVLCGGKVMPFNKACPLGDRDIRAIFSNPHPYWVFTYKLEEICPNETMRKRLLESRNQRIACLRRQAKK